MPHLSLPFAGRIEGPSWGAQAEAGEFSGDEVLTSALFPGLALPLGRLFRS